MNHHYHQLYLKFIAKLIHQQIKNSKSLEQYYLKTLILILLEPINI